jgi:tetratricopeptide (TPR) repeat protein
MFLWAALGSYSAPRPQRSSRGWSTRRPLACGLRACPCSTAHSGQGLSYEDLGIPWSSTSAVFTRTILELLAGAPVLAERAARAGLQAFEAMHNRNQGSTAAALLGLALIEQGRDDEALEYADLAAAWAVRDDLHSQTGALAIRARVLARRGELAAAETAARGEVALSKASDEPKLRGDALVNLAFVLEHAGRADEAADALSAALAVYERKGNIAAASRARALIESERRRAGVTDP